MPTRGPLQRFQASNGCGQKDCAQTLGTAFWGRENDGVLYVWDRRDVLRAYNFVNNRFVTTPAAVSTVKPGMTGGPTVSANGSDVSSGIVWAVTTQSTRSGGRAPGTLRAFRASNVEPGNLQFRHQQRPRRARRFHEVCAAGGREWKSVRADAVEDSHRLWPSRRPLGFSTSSGASESCLAPFRRVEKPPSAAALTIPGVGWGLPGSGGPTGHHRGFADHRPRTHRRRRPGRLRGGFTPIDDHAAQRSRRHDPLAPLILQLDLSSGMAAPAVSIESRL